MTDNLFTLAEDAAKALAAYEKGLAGKKTGHKQVIDAIIAYGDALSKGRNAHKSNDEFGKWIVANRLDQTKPFDLRQERSAAMQVSKIVIDSSRTVDDISECSHSRPNNIMAWVRKQPWFEKKERAPRIVKPPKRAKAGRPRKGEPKPVPLAPLAGMPKFSSEEEKRKWVDPEFVGTWQDWTDKYGHVWQVMTAEENTQPKSDSPWPGAVAYADFSTWRQSSYRNCRKSITTGCEAQSRPLLENWPKLWSISVPLIAEAEALLERGS